MANRAGHRAAVSLFFTSVLLCGCDEPGGDPDADVVTDSDIDRGTDADGDGDADADTDIEQRPPLLCLEPEPIGDGPYFTDVTEELGLGPSGLDIQGGQVSSADIDGNGYPDLILHRGVRGVRDDPEAPVFNGRIIRNLGDGAFEDHTFASGFYDTRDGGWGRPATFAVFADLDNDGDLDAFSATFVDQTTTDTGDHSEILLNRGDGTFELGPEGDFSDHPTVDPVVAAALLDYDLDGVVDIFSGQHYCRYGSLGSSVQDNLYQGGGDGTFVDVTDEAGLATVTPDNESLRNGTSHRPTWGVSACDLDGDGWQDLLQTSYGRQFNLLWHNRGDGTYEDISFAAGFASDENTDYTDDELYSCHCHEFGAECDPMPAPPRILCGDVDYWSPINTELFRLGGNSSASICGDVDGDGDIDVLAVELAHWNTGQSSDRTQLLINEGVGQGGAFVRPGIEATGLDRVHGPSWQEGDLGGALLDFDNDGRLDILILSSDYPVTFSLLYHQTADGTFEEVGELGGARIQRAHGATVVDYDRDGDSDLVVGTSLHRWEPEDNPPPPDAAYMYVLRNDVGQNQNRIMIDLEGAGPPGANRSAIGARVEVRVGETVYVRELSAGMGVDGYQHDSLLIVGLGQACEADEVVIRWPNLDHTVTTINAVPANYVLRVHETDGYSFATLDEYVGR